jgi:hypothetical protein
MNYVDAARRTLTLELLSEGDGLSGRAFSEDGAVREFTGRIGLMHAIDELLVEASPSEPAVQIKRRKE